MSWLKMGCWVLFGGLVTGGAACGGRGNLAGGELPDTAGATSGGGRPSGGTVGVGGRTMNGGTRSFGGSVSTAGLPSVGGVGGQPNVCTPGVAFCAGNVLEICTGPADAYILQDCGPMQRCVQQGLKGACQPLQCKPGQMLCDATGKFAQVCSPDGVALNKVDCGAQGQRCQDGACKSLACQPNQLFCDKTSVKLCNADGSASMVRQACGANQYCDPLAPSCKQGVCAPGQPACNGSIATTCNANGSGYQPMGVDCNSQPDRQCVQGACLCPPSLADCDGSAKTGCESNVSTDPNNCTGCGFVCSKNNIPSPTCDDGCNGKCAIGFQDCNGDKLSDGCETGIASDAKNCGGCGLACSNNHVTASCSASVCNGACAANFNDCNASKLKDGCESDSRTDLKNCGACGVACSTSHLKPTCTAGACGGSCDPGFDDCNGNKQSDGCETNTLNDIKNCGACGNACQAGEACVNGKCGSLLTFSGVAQNLAISSLTGWTQCFSETYSQGVTSVASVQKACTGSLLMMACRPAGATTLQVAAYAPRADVFFDTGSGNDPHVANGVGWYYSDSQSWGFAPSGDAILRNSCDTQDSSIDATGVDGGLRLCWHTSNALLQGGWRCGADDNLNGSFGFERLVFQAN